MIRDNIADQLVYSTVKLTCYTSSLISNATAFFMSIDLDATNITALVTNKHAVTLDKEHKQFFEKADIVLTKSDNNGNPLNKEHVSIHIDSLKKRCVFHPDDNIDLCFIFIKDLIENEIKSGTKLYYRCIGENLIVPEEKLTEFTPIEDIIMIGYPIGLIDEENNKPVIRKGITATDLRLNYNGKNEFVIDAACFHGSSGSPVFLRKMGLSKEQSNKGLTIGMQPLYAFLGVLYAGPVETIDGEIKIKTIPTANVLHSESEHTINLGYVIKANVIIDLFQKVAENDKNGSI